jgi:hypothetical protein
MRDTEVRTAHHAGDQNDGQRSIPEPCHNRNPFRGDSNDTAVAVT